MDKFMCRGKEPIDEYFNGDDWVVGYYTCFNGVEHRIYSGYAETDCGDYYPDWYNVIPETVGRYTGKNDIHYEEIFEGDIIREGCNGLVGVVVYDDSLGTYKLDGFGEGYTIQDSHIEWEIIGNIYDNPELMNN